MLAFNSCFRFFFSAIIICESSHPLRAKTVPFTGRVGVGVEGGVGLLRSGRAVSLFTTSNVEFCLDTFVISCP